MDEGLELVKPFKSKPTRRRKQSGSGAQAMSEPQGQEKSSPCSAQAPALEG